MLAVRRVAQQHSGTALRALSTTSTAAAAARTKKADNDNGRSNGFAAIGAGILGALTAGTVTLLEEKKQKLPTPKYTLPNPIPIHGKESHHGDYNDPPPRPDLPTLTLEEVSEHSDEESLWYTFRGAVYDLTL